MLNWVTPLFLSGPGFFSNSAQRMCWSGRAQEPGPCLQPAPLHSPVSTTLVLGGASLPVPCAVCLWTHCPWICLIPFWTCWYCLSVADVTGHHCDSKFQEFTTVSVEMYLLLLILNDFLLVSVNGSHMNNTEFSEKQFYEYLIHSLHNFVNLDQIPCQTFPF